VNDFGRNGRSQTLGRICNGHSQDGAQLGSPACGKRDAPERLPPTQLFRLDRVRETHRRGSRQAPRQASGL